MLDLLGPSKTELARCLRNSAENTTALHIILLEKGICTPEEFEAARMRAISLLDQAVAERRTQADEDAAKAEEFFGQVLGGGKATE